MRLMNNSRSGHGRHETGVAIVEFTIVLPLMLLLILVVAEFGRAFLYYNTLTRAVRDSARYVASNALKGQSQVVEVDADLVQAAQNLVDYGNATGAGTPTTAWDSAGTVTVIDEGDGVVTVIASYPYVPMVGNLLPDFARGGGISTVFTMHAQVTVPAI